ncbi:hypothetical protein UNDKW_1661 [Undibacterium sp. KW1]|nr:hypothetical protein UNDKW_1661 [Undibacterium sp. KW1]
MQAHLRYVAVLDFGNGAKADDILQVAGEVGKGEFHADYGDVTGLASHAGRGAMEDSNSDINRVMMNFEGLNPVLLNKCQIC